jgi:hypothetical protein
MRVFFLALLLAMLAAVPPTPVLAAGPVQDEAQPEVEGPPVPSEADETDEPETDEPETDEPETGEAESDESAAETDGSEAETDEPREELEGPDEDQAPEEPDLLIGLDPSGMPYVPEREPTKYGSEDVRRGLFLIGAGIGIGIFAPRDVNNYLDDWTTAQGAVETIGFSEMVINYAPRITASYIPIEYVQLQILGEIGWSPKVMTISGSGVEDGAEWFHYVRYSPGALANFHLPVNSNRQAIFVGGGVIYHWLRFEGGGADYKAEALGYRAQLGYRFYVRAFAPEIFVAFDYVKGDSRKAIAPGERDLVLEYTGGMVGGNFYFDLTSAIGAGSGPDSGA